MTARPLISRRTGAVAWIAALTALVLSGCSIENALPGYADTPSAFVQDANPPDLLPTEAFAADIAIAAAGRAPAQAQTEALLARAALLRLHPLH